MKYLKRLNKNFYYKYSSKTKKILDDILKDDVNINLEKEFLDEFIIKNIIQLWKDLDIIKSWQHLVGFHGQTIYHNPRNKISIQLGGSNKN